MRFAAILLAILTTDTTLPLVTARDGNIVYTDPDGVARALTSDGGYSQPTLAPDGHLVAFIHRDTRVDTGRVDSIEDGTTSLWVADSVTGTIRRVTTPHRDNRPEHNFAVLHAPVFSPDGGTVYVSANAWVTSSAVHQIDVKTGRERFVIDGDVSGVIRTGPYRGYLLVGRHRYHAAPNYGSYDPVYVVRPNGRSSFIVPGSAEDEGQESVAAWLKAKGWRAEMVCPE